MIKKKIVKSYNWLLENFDVDDYSFDSADIEEKEIYKHTEIVNNYLVQKLIEIEGIDEEKVRVQNKKYGSYKPEYIAFVFINGEEKYRIYITQKKLYNISWRLIIVIETWSGKKKNKRKERKDYLLNIDYPKKHLEKVVDNLKYYLEDLGSQITFNNIETEFEKYLQGSENYKQNVLLEVVNFIFTFLCKDEKEELEEILRGFEIAKNNIDDQDYLEYYFGRIEEIINVPVAYILLEAKTDYNKKKKKKFEKKRDQGQNTVIVEIEHGYSEPLIERGRKVKININTEIEILEHLIIHYEKQKEQLF